MEQQEKEPEKSVCVKLVTPVICLLHILQECIQIDQWLDPLPPCFISLHAYAQRVQKDTLAVTQTLHNSLG